MEALQPIDLFLLPIKHSTCSLEVEPFLIFVLSYYEVDKRTLEQSILELIRMRQSMQVQTSFSAAINMTKAYYSQLCSFESKFPSTDELRISTEWFDTILNSTVELSSFHNEKMSVLSSIAHLAANAALEETRTSSEGLKNCFKLYQLSAWCMEEILNSYRENLEMESWDLSYTYCRFQHALFLAQAQECVVTKSLIESGVPVVTARLCKHLTETYELMREQISNKKLATLLREPKFGRDIPPMVDLKVELYKAISMFHMSLAKTSEEAHGEAIAWCEAAFKASEATMKIAKSFKPKTNISFESFVKSLHTIIDAKLQALNKENTLIYHEKIPLFDQLEKPNPVCIAKPLGFSITDPTVMGKELFKFIVPIQTVLATSIYSEVKAQKLRSLTQAVELANNELEKNIDIINLDPEELKQADDPIPQSLYDACAKIQASDLEGQSIESKFESDVQKLKQSNAETTERIDTLRSNIEAAILSATSIAASGNVRAAELKKQLSEQGKKLSPLSKLLKEALESNNQLCGAISQSLQLFKELKVSISELESSLPSVKPIQA
ncbi:Tyrosine-protein phosphatase non-receptor type 23, partial [Cichlidogyrus casuarinus]